MAEASLSKSDRELFEVDLKCALDVAMNNVNSLEVILDMVGETLEECLPEFKDESLDEFKVQSRLFVLLEAARNKLTQIGDEGVGRAEHARLAIYGQ